MESFIHRKINDELMKAQNPVFISDERIDGDSLGASLAMVDYMKQNDKPRPAVYVTEKVPDQYLEMPHVDVCTYDKEVFNDPTIDLVVVFDCSDDVYVRGLLEHIPNKPRVINIDHHNTNPHYGDINQVIVGSPATAEVVFRFFETNGVVVGKDAATCLLTGLCFDTTAFSNEATNDLALSAASKLILQGARVQDVISAMFKNRSIAALRVWGTALERLHFNKEYDCVITCLVRDDIENNQVTDDEIGGLTNFLSLVTDTDALYVLRETVDGGVNVSMRSSLRDVSQIAKQNGGGGHKKAAGYTISNAKLKCVDGESWKVEKAVN